MAPVVSDLSIYTDDLWHCASDLGFRRRFFAEEVFSHPAKLNLHMLQRIVDLYTLPWDTLLDPMAGTGSLMVAATQQRNVIVRDLMPEYVAMMQASLPIIHRRGGLFCGLVDIDQGDAKTLLCPRFDHIIMSPPYGFETGNGISNHRRARILAEQKHGDRWRKYIEAPNHASFASGFRYAGGQQNTGNKSGRNYWQDMGSIYAHLTELLPSGGYMILILKNHYRRGKLRDVVSKTIAVVDGQKMNLVARHGRYIDNPSLWQRRRREQGLPIVDIEDALVFEKV